MQTRAAPRMGVHGLDLSALRAVFEPLHPWLELAKPGVTRLVVITTLLGGGVAPGRLSFGHWLCVLLGTVLVVAAANALNMVSEADLDALMPRTRQRPLPSGRLDPRAAVRAALGAAVAGTGLLLCIGVVPAVLALAALVSYVWVYTPLKRITPHALFVGAVPGAVPPLIGYASVTGGRIDAQAIALFLLLAVWQVPHFLAIATFRKDEYARAGLPVFTVCRSREEVRRLMLGWSLALFAASLWPVWLGMGGTLYAALAVGFGLPFLFGAAYGLRSCADVRWARSLFFASMPHLVVLFLGLAL